MQRAGRVWSGLSVLALVHTARFVRSALRAAAMIVLAWLLLASAAMASANPQPASMPLGNEANPYAPAVAKLVAAIIPYTRWPNQRDPLRMCIIGPADHAGDLLAARGRGAAGVASVEVPAAAVTPESCDLVYIGRLALPDQRLITGRLRDKAVLTIAENDPACQSRAMFCLLFEAEALSFRLNIEAVANSKLRIDPRVLRLAAKERS